MKIPASVILLLLITPIFISLVRPGFFPMQDDLQAFRVHQMYECFKDYQIPCRFVPDAGYQYGYPQFNYYPPSVYYLGATLHLLGFQIIDSVKILFILGYILSALTMYLMLRSLVPIWPALVGSLLYSYIPYKAVEVYVRGALSEFWALVIFPLIFWSIVRLIRSGKLQYLLWLALSTGGLLLTHNLMSMIFLPLALIWGLTWLYLEKRWDLLPKLTLGALLGVGLASFFTLPVVFEGQYVHIESLLGGYFDYRQHFVDLEQLFISNHWGFGSSYLGPGDDLSLSTGQIQALLSMAGLLAVPLVSRKQPKLALVYLGVFFLEMLVLFLTHQRSSFIWEYVGILSWLQFPWRLLADSIFLLATLSALTVYFIELLEIKLRRVKLSVIVGVLAVGLAIYLHLPFFQPKDWLTLTDQEKFSGYLWEKQLTISIFDYLPIYAVLPPITKALEVPEVLEGKVQFLDYRKRSYYQQGQVLVKSESRLRLPFFDFPGMIASIDGRVVDHWHDDCRDQEFCLGLVTFKVPEGKHIIKAEIKNTPVRTVGDSLTVVSLIAVTVMAYQIIKSKR